MPHDPTRAPPPADRPETTGLATLSPEGDVRSWSEGAEQILGVSADEAVGAELDTLLSAEVGDAGGGLLAAARARGQAEWSGWARARDGSRAWLEAALVRVRDEGGDAAGFALVLRDLTARRHAEEEVRRSQTIFEGILAIASDAVVCVNSEQRITFFNQGAERMFGYAEGEVLGEPLEVLIPHGSRPGHARQVTEFGGSPVPARIMGERGEIAGLRRNGEVFPAEASISKLRVGDTLVYTAVLRDVTERKQAEEAMARQARELERSNEELEQFAYVASHDLQEPLRMVASYTKLLERRYSQQLDDDAREFIGFAVDGVTRMQQMINDLLTYSRAGRREIHAAEVDLGWVAERVGATLQPTMEEAGAEIQIEPLPVVSGDAAQLGQLLQNLIQNAVKFRRPGVPPRVRVDAVEEADHWHVRVADNGIGIEPEYAERIFVLFQRLHSRHEYPGTGIGLAICKRIVERHGGTLWVTPNEGGGSVFHFTLSRAEEPA